jgi:hypothetical protein
MSLKDCRARKQTRKRETICPEHYTGSMTVVEADTAGYWALQVPAIIFSIGDGVGSQRHPVGDPGQRGFARQSPQASIC